jgi:flagellar biosynthesis protein FlhA
MPNFRERLKVIFEYRIPIEVMSLTLMLIIPLPDILLDILMVMNLITCIVILLLVICRKKAIDFSFLPTVLLIVSGFGLFLNISFTRLILTKGVNFTGRIIQALSAFIVGSDSIESLVIGVTIFTVSVIISAMLITKGATHTAEMVARFTLDSWSEKQMAINAECNSGIITEEEAKSRKDALQHEGYFSGVMDGSINFISRNFKAGVLITVFTILIGIFIGVKIHGEPITETVGIYVPFAMIVSLLTTQFPVLLMSTTAGIIVTRLVQKNSGIR